jgi:hypothetical protein
LYTASFVSFFPFFLGWLGGQDTVFIVLGLLFWTFGIVDHKDAQAGSGLALASLSPLVTLAFGAPMLAARKKTALWFIFSMISLGVYSLVLVGFEGGKEFIGLMLLSSKGEGFGLNQPAMYNFLGFLLRLLPSSFEGFLRLFSWLSFVTFLVVFGWLWWRWKNDLRLEHIGITVLIGTFLLPHLHIHGLSYLLIPTLAYTMLLYAKDENWKALLFLPRVCMQIPK